MVINLIQFFIFVLIGKESILLLQILILIFFFACSLACFFLYKNIISPPVILSIEWLITFGFYYFSPFNDFVESPYYLVFIMGHLLFIIGFVLVCRPSSFKNGFNKIKKDVEYSINKRAFALLVILQILLLVYGGSHALKIASSNFIQNYWYSLKYAKAMGTYNNGTLFGYAQTLSFVITFIISGLYFISKDRKLKKMFILQLALSTLFAILSLGRTFLFELFIPIFFIYIIINSKSLFHSFKVLISFIGTLLLVFFAINSLKTVGATSGMMNSFYLYMSGSIKALISWIELNNNYIYGQNTFRFFLALIHSLGFGNDTSKPKLVEGYIPIGNGYATNVYSIYKWYYSDFGLWYALFIEFALGILHGYLFKNAYKKRTISSIIFLSIFYYPLLMQFFEDQYVSLTSTWIQIFFWMFIIFKNGLFVKQIWKVTSEDISHSKKLLNNTRG